MKKSTENSSSFVINGIETNLSTDLLKALHILTVDGKLNQDSRRKLKQVAHLAQFLEPLLRQVIADRGTINLVDHGAGKSYLGFILYDLFLQSGDSGHVIGIDVRADLVSKSQALAAKLGFERMTFFNMTTAQSIDSGKLPDDVDLVTALHACDTATDDAIQFALSKRAQFMALVPCCQAEVAAELRRLKSNALSAGALAEIWRHPIHTRDFGSLITNALRCLMLEAHGYQVTVTELTGWEHSLKNELIIARRGNAPRGNAKARLTQILDELGLNQLASRFAC